MATGSPAARRRRLRTADRRRGAREGRPRSSGRGCRAWPQGTLGVERGARLHGPTVAPGPVLSRTILMPGESIHRQWASGT